MTAPAVRVSTRVLRIFCFLSSNVVHENRFRETFESQEQP